MFKRTKFILANWKMNKNSNETIDFLNALNNNLPPTKQLQVGIAAQNVYLEKMVNYVRSNNIPLEIFSENLFYTQEGSYTGETSPAALTDIGIKGSIIGHYERRNLFKESNGIIGLKVAASLKNKLIPVLAISEDTTDYDPESASMSPLTELAIALAGVDKSIANNIVIAYEPSWAIGTNKTMTNLDITHAAKVIRKSLKIILGDNIADQVRILYGGAVNTQNANTIFNLSNIDGLLIGRASLSHNSFLEIINSVTNV